MRAHLRDATADRPSQARTCSAEKTSHNDECARHAMKADAAINGTERNETDRMRIAIAAENRRSTKSSAQIRPETCADSRMTEPYFAFRWAGTSTSSH
jgi:hypothetical protein